MLIAACIFAKPAPAPRERLDVPPGTCALAANANFAMRGPPTTPLGLLGSVCGQTNCPGDAMVACTNRLLRQVVLPGAAGALYLADAEVVQEQYSVRAFALQKSEEASRVAAVAAADKIAADERAVRVETLAQERVAAAEKRAAKMQQSLDDSRLEAAALKESHATLVAQQKVAAAAALVLQRNTTEAREALAAAEAAGAEQQRIAEDAVRALQKMTAKKEKYQKELKELKRVHKRLMRAHSDVKVARLV